MTRTDGRPPCVLCGGSGWVSVPHPRCVWNGRVVRYPGYPGVVTCGVVCECPAGPAGLGALTWDRYTGLIGGLDGVAMLIEYTEAQARAARGDTPPGKNLSDLYPRLAGLAGLAPAPAGGSFAA